MYNVVHTLITQGYKTMTHVLIKHGKHHINTFVEEVFEMVSPWKQGSKGGFVTVINDVNTPNPLLPLAPRRCRIICNEEDVVYVTKAEGTNELIANDNSTGGTTTIALPEAPKNYTELVHAIETRDEAIDRVRSTFSMIDDVTEASIEGHMRGVVISGPPGIGKSHGVMETLITSFGNSSIDEQFTQIKGTCSGIGLYKMLYEYRDEGKVVVFDDCDAIFHDDETLNILKAALDSSESRVISWYKESKALADEDIPRRFEFNGSVIFLTNLDFEETRGRIKPHLDAIISRCHYVSLEMASKQDQLIRIEQVVADGMLSRYEFNESELAEIVNFVMTNADDLRELSLRMVTKIADLYKMSNDKWREFAVSTCLRRSAKFKHIYDTLTEDSGRERA